MRAIVLCVLLGCAPNASLELPEPSSSDGLLLFHLGAGPTLVYATDAASVGALRLLREPDDRLALLYIPETLDRLSVMPNQGFPDSAPGGRAIPPSRIAYQRADGPWESIPELPPELRDFRIPAVDALACLASDRCYGPADDDYACIPCPIAAEPMAPAHARLPVMTPCAPGWTLHASTSTGAPSTCDSQPVDCGAGALSIPSAPSCVAFATCPTGTWPTPLPIGPELRYVGPDPGGVPAGRVHATLAEALLAAGSGDRVLLSAGDHPLSAIARDVRIDGVCGGARIVPSPAEITASATISGVTWAAGAVHVQNAGQLAIDGSEVAIADWHVFRGGRLSIARSVVRAQDPSLETAGPMRVEHVAWHGRGITVDDELHVADSVFFGGGASGLSGRPSASITIVRSVMEGCDPALEVRGAIDVDTVLFLGGGTTIDGKTATVTASRIELRDTRGKALSFRGGRVLLGDVIIDRTRDVPGSLSTPIRAVSGEQGCAPERFHLEAERVLVRDNRADAPLVQCATARIEDLAIDDANSSGLRVEGGVVDGRRWSVQRSGEIAVRLGVFSPPSGLVERARVTLEDLDISASKGEGLAIGNEIDLQATRSCINGSVTHGVALWGRGGTARFDELEIEQVESSGLDGACFYVAGEPGAPIDAEVRHFELERCLFGVDLRSSVHLLLYDGHIRETGSAFSILADEIDARDLLRGVRLEGNDVTGLE